MPVLWDGDEELDPGDWWVVSQGCNGQGGKKGKRSKREKEGHLPGAGGAPLPHPGEAEAHLREALQEGDDGDDGDDGMTGMTRGTRVATRGRGVTRGVRWGVTGGREGRGQGGEKGGARSKDAPRQPPTTHEG